VGSTKNRRKHIKNSFLLGSSIALGTSSCDEPKTDLKARTNKKLKTHKWKMVTTWPKNFPGLGTGANKLAKYIEDLSDGRISLKVYGASELVPALGVFDAVQRGSVQIGHGASYYWQGRHPATSFFASVPFGLNAHEMNAWIYYGGGQELWHKLYKPFGLLSFPAGNTGVQMGGWFNKKINEPRDFKGLKVRMPGLGGRVLSKLGATVVTLSGGDIFQALKTKNIDGSEWVGPYNDLAIGLHKAAKYYYTPGWHEPGTCLEALINKKAFNELDDHLKSCVELACKAANQDMMSEFTLKNSLALSEVVKNKEVEILRFSDSVLSVLKETSNSVVKDISEHDEISKEIYDSFKNFKEACMDWDKASEHSFSLARQVKSAK